MNMAVIVIVVQKTVINFSVLTDEEVQQYFILHHGENICGRFKNSQLKTIIIDIPGKVNR